MRIEQETFHYFSDELYDSAFPVKCTFLKWLTVTDSPACAMIARAEVPFGPSKLAEFIILPKGGKSFDDVPDQDIFPVFVFAIDDRVQGNALDLRDGLKNVQDWGCICFSPQFAKSHSPTA